MRERVLSFHINCDRAFIFLNAIELSIRSMIKHISYSLIECNVFLCMTFFVSLPIKREGMNE